MNSPVSVYEPMADKMRFAVFAPIGPDDHEAERLADLLESLWFYEPSVSTIVLVLDGISKRDFAKRCRFLPPAPCQTVVLENPRKANAFRLTGGLCVASLTAVKWIHDNTEARFLVKLDTDSLVIAPFAHKINQAFESLPQAGMLGTIGRTCNEQSGEFGYCEDAAMKLSVALKYWRTNIQRSPYPHQVEIPIGDGFSLTLPVEQVQAEAFSAVRPHIMKAVLNGYPVGRYCQGGGYALKRDAIHRMADAGYLEDLVIWQHIPFGEDVVMSMYAYAAGFAVVGLPEPLNPFGIQWKGLPFPPQELISRGYSVIHSVKSDENFTESSIRSFFRGLRVDRVMASKEAPL